MTVLTRAIPIASLFCSLAIAPIPALAQDAATSDRWVEVKDAEGVVEGNDGAVNVGDRLQSSEHEITTSSEGGATLAVDDGIATVEVGENSNVRLGGLQTLPSGAKTTMLQLNRGRVRVKVREFTNPESRFAIATPAGTAGVRGTEFGVVVLPNGETRISVLDGEVEIEALDRSYVASGGYSSLIVPGEPPTEPSLTDSNGRFRVKVLSGDRAGDVQVSAEVHPVSAVFLNGEAVEVGRDGRVNAIVPIPDNRLLQLVVRNPLGDEQVYELELP